MGTQHILSPSESEAPATHSGLELLKKQNDGHLALRLTSEALRR